MQKVSTENTVAPKVKLPDIKAMLETGVQFGHQTKRWNPKMQKYIFAKKGNFHIIDISQTLPLLEEAAVFLTKAASEGDVLFVGTKRQAVDIVEQEAIRCGAHYITNRWVGGLFSNFEIVRKSINKLNELEKILQEGVENRTKQEIYWMKRVLARLERLFSGVKQMTSLPKVIVIIDANYEKKTVKEAKKMKIPIVAVVDTNSDPDLVDYPIPGNDDALGSIKLFMKTFADAVLLGNKGNGIKHKQMDLAALEIKIIKKTREPKIEEKEEKIITQTEALKPEIVKPEPETEKNKLKKGKVKKATLISRKEKKVTPKIKISKTIKKVKLDKKIEALLVKNKISLEILKQMKDSDILDLKGVGAKTFQTIKKTLKSL